MNTIEAAWMYIEGQPGEVFSLSTGGTKHALVWTEAELVAEFLLSLEDVSLKISVLENSTLKDAYLRAAMVLGASRVLFNYKRGTHSAQVLEISELLY